MADQIKDTSRKRLEHINQVLRAILKVNRLIVMEIDPGRLISGACKILVGTRGYHNVWISLFDEEGSLENVAHRGVGKEFPSVIKLLRKKKRTYCQQRALQAPGVRVIADPPTTCSVCPLSSRYRGRAGMVSRLEYEGRLYGTITVSLPGSMADDAEEQDLFAELAGDLSYALHKMEIQSEGKKAEIEAEKSREILDRVQHIARVGDFSWDVRSGKVTWSKSLFALLRYDPGEKIDYSRVNREIHHPEDRKRVNRWLEESLASGKEELPPNEYRLIRRDGRTIHVRTVGVIQREGKSARVFATVQDITDWKVTEKNLDVSEERFRSLYETMAQGVVYQDKSGRIIAANPAAERILGRTTEQMIGKDSAAEDWRAVHEDGSEFPGDGHPSMVALRTGKRVENVIMGIFNPRDQARRWIRVNAIPQFREREKVPYQVYTTLDDVTRSRKMQKELDQYRHYLEKQIEERTKRLHQALEDSETSREWLDTIFKSVSEGLVVTDITRRISMMNPLAEEWMGVRFSEVYNQPVGRALKIPGLPGLVKQALSESPRIITADVDLPDTGKMQGVVLNVSAKTILDQGRKANGVLITLRDVTREREISRQKTDFLSMAAHELRTPLTTLQGFSEILLIRRDLKDPDREKFLGYINRQAVNLANIVRDLLDVSRMEVGKGFYLKREPCSLNAIITRLVDYYRVSQPEHTFVTRLEKSSLRIYAESEKMEQVLMNLISNAVNYSPRGGKITVATAIRGSCYQITVTDQGIGMTRAQTGRMFERFYRADTSDSAPPGSGLGMHIAKQIIDRHRGRIRVESQPGKGTRIQVLLPVGLRDIDRDSLKTGQDRRKPGGKKKDA